MDTDEAPHADEARERGPTYDFDATLWLWDARATDSWTFVSLPEEVADEVLELAGPVARGFGSTRVEATIGGTVWRTSLFPDNARRTYVLPIKRAVRRAEGLEAGGPARVRVRLLDVPEAEPASSTSGTGPGDSTPTPSCG